MPIVSRRRIEATIAWMQQEHPKLLHASKNYLGVELEEFTREELITLLRDHIVVGGCRNWLPEPPEETLNETDQHLRD